MKIQALIDKIDHVFIDQVSAESEVSLRFQKLFPKNKISFVEKRPFTNTKGSLSSEEFDRSKKNIYLTPFKGQFFKRCPGSRPGLACCNYFVLNWGLQCDMNCSYCYLQTFINTPLLTIYTNIDDALNELKSFIPKMGDQTVRIGTGETVDSLSLDPLTLYSHKLIDFFNDLPNWNLEFKTKSDFVEQFIDVPHSGNTVVSWSLNAKEIVKKEEHGTAPLEHRLRAAELCRSKGFPIAFHIDPLIWHPNWKDSYAGLVKEITTRFSPTDMPYISIGALRFQPEQKAMMRERFGMDSWVTQAEMFPGDDGKLRYHQQIRSEMFQFLQRQFQKASNDWKIFLCMETPETWLKTQQEVPQKSRHLKDLFDNRVVRKFDKTRKDLNNSEL